MRGEGRGSGPLSRGPWPEYLVALLGIGLLEDWVGVPSLLPYPLGLALLWWALALARPEDHSIVKAGGWARTSLTLSLVSLGAGVLLDLVLVSWSPVIRTSFLVGLGGIVPYGMLRKDLSRGG